MAGEVRKSIGEEGGRQQTALVFLLLLVVGLALYLPGNWAFPHFAFKVPEWGSGEIITIVGKAKPASPRPQPNINALIETQTGDWGIFVKSLNSDQGVSIGENLVMTAASVIKLPVLMIYYQAVDNGSVDPDSTYILQESDRWEYGTGSMQYQPVGKVYTYRQIAQLVANQSDNMAAEVLIKKLGGYARVQQAIDKLGFSGINLKENEITALAAGELFWQLAKEKILIDTSREELFTNLTNTVNEDRIPAGVPEGAKVIHKFGSEAGVVNDCGIVQVNNPYVICVLTTQVNSGEAEKILPKISELVWQWLGD